jgi:hypothetical protein
VALTIWTMTGGPAEAACLRALRALAAGDVAVAADFAEAPCEAAGAALAYDRGLRVARLRRDVVAGEVVRGAPAMLSSVRPGQGLTLQARSGPVTVERRVEVVRPARAGERILVKGADGRVFAAPAPGP